MEKYIVNGMINSNEIVSKKFKTNKKALNYINKLCENYDIEVEEIIENKYRKTFIVDNYTMFNVDTL